VAVVSNSLQAGFNTFIISCGKNTLLKSDFMTTSASSIMSNFTEVCMNFWIEFFKFPLVVIKMWHPFELNC